MRLQLTKRTDYAIRACLQPCALATPHRLPHEEQPEMREQEGARPPVADAPRKRGLQREQHRAQPPLGMAGGYPAAVGAGLRWRVHAGRGRQGSVALLCHQEIVSGLPPTIS